jgi:hypothetical protein
LARQLGVAAFAHADEFVLADAIMDVRIGAFLLGDRRFPGELLAARRLIVVAHEEAGVVRERQSLRIDP